ncbi:uncharacterized protein LOC126939423 [Macaca thibetana thibetana]|uniref:uncharacterized protein LOC126939423 n=1 Tax=Macaca thibetana thibetana TaxID=257877 RepID=UPI0021BCE998|nr:uncharacterized protein LOC126939423 [Macaca thibetana thibetana]
MRTPAQDVVKTKGDSAHVKHGPSAYKHRFLPVESGVRKCSTQDALVPSIFQAVPTLSPNEGGDGSPTSFQVLGCTRPLRMPGGGSCQFSPPFLLLPGSSGGRLKAGLWRLIKQVSLLLRGCFNQGDATGGIISCTRTGAHRVAREEPLSSGSRGGSVHAFVCVY